MVCDDQKVKVFGNLHKQSNTYTNFKAVQQVALGDWIHDWQVSFRR